MKLWQALVIWVLGCIGLTFFVEWLSDGDLPTYVYLLIGALWMMFILSIIERKERK
jgi:hypothetical protein